MKKFIASITLALMVAILPLSLVGCGKKSNSAVIGVWEYTGWETENVEGEYDGRHEPFKETDYEGVCWEFKNDGTVIKHSAWEEEPDEVPSTYTWKSGKNGKIIVTEKAYDEKKDEYYYEEINFEINDGQLIESYPQFGKDGEHVLYIVKRIYTRKG